MAMQLSFSNIFQLFSTLSPILLGFFLVMISMFNQDIKGLVYLGGVLIASLINLLLMNTIKHKTDPDMSPSCNLIEFPFNLNEYNSPAFNNMFISFTFFYLFMPMKYITTINFPVLISIISIFCIDTITKMMNKCISISGALIGTLVGAILGIVWFIIFYSTDNKDMLFFNSEPSNNVVCSRPKEQSFKCSVYKNGEIIKQL
jgi:hypothetical protein